MGVGGRGSDEFGKGRRPESIGRRQVLALRQALRRPSLIVANQELFLELFIDDKLNAPLGTTPIGSGESLPKTFNPFFSVDARNRVTVAGVCFLAGRAIGQELHASLYHPDGVGDGVTSHALEEGREVGRERRKIRV